MTHVDIHDFELDGQAWLIVSYTPCRRRTILSALSPSEFAVVERWLEGESAHQIARHRAVSVRTISNQIASAYEKLGVSSRTELLCLVHGHGDL